MRQIWDGIGWDRKAVVFTGLVVAFTVLGPFGTYGDLGLSQRFVYWVAIVTGVAVFMHVGITLTLRAHPLTGWPDALRITLGAVLAALPGAGIVAFVDEVFRASGIDAASLVRLWAQVAVIGVLAGLAEFSDWRPGKSAEKRPELCSFQRRLSPRLGTDIVSLSMQDHYVEVTTTLGREMLLMRFCDAIAELDALPGLRIHRSHWIALKHLRSMHKTGHRTEALLDDGRALPVSATYQAALAAHLAA